MKAMIYFSSELLDVRLVEGEVVHHSINRKKNHRDGDEVLFEQENVQTAKFMK